MTMIIHRSTIIGFIICIHWMQITSKIRSNKMNKYKSTTRKINKSYSMRISLAMEAERRSALIHCVMDCLLSAEKYIGLPEMA